MRSDLTSIILLFFSLFSFVEVNSQVLINQSIDLNPGGVVHDIAYDSYRDMYIVVGDFSTIQSGNRNNIAFLNGQDLSLLSEADHPKIETNGPVYSVALHKKESFFTCPPLLPCQYTTGRYSIFFGGDFTTIDGISRNKLARYTYTFTNTPATNGDYILANWDAELLDNDPSNDPLYYDVSDLHVQNDTLVVGGEFNIDQPSYDANITRNDLIAFNVSLGSVEYCSLFTESNSDYLMLNSIANIVNTGRNIGEIEYYNGIYYFTAPNESSESGKFFSYDYSTNSINQFNTASCGTNVNILDVTLSFYNNQSPKFYVLQDDCSGSTPYSFQFDLLGNQLFNVNGEWTGLNFSDAYKNKVYTVTGNSGNAQEIVTYERTNNNVAPVNNIPFNHSGAGIYSSFFDWLPDNFNQQTWQSKKLRVVEDKLFFIGKYINIIDGAPRQGFGAFCLEPKDAEPFTVADTTICNGNTREYTIPQTEYAQGYKWTYTGDGVYIRINGSTSDCDTLTPGESVYYDGTNANSVEIEFGMNTTNGTLTVEPYSYCNGTNDTLLSNGQSINLITAPLPSLTMLSDSLAFNCFNSDSVQLEMITSGTNYSFTWTTEDDQLTTLSSDSVFIVYNDDPSDSSINVPTNFIGSVIEPINGCTSQDTISVIYDTIPPDPQDFNLYTTPSQFDCSTDSMVFQGDVPNSAIEWGLTNSTTFASDSFTIYTPSNDTATVFAHATDTTNGCKSEKEFGFIELFDSIEPIFPDYGTYSGGTIDTIKCTPPELLLAIDLPNLNYSLPNDSVSWFYNNQYIGDSLFLSAQDTIGTNGNNYLIIDYTTYSDSSKCTFNGQVTVEFDLEPPFIPEMNNIPTINCSTDSALLDHPIVDTSLYSQGWLDNNFQNTLNDSIYTDTSGTFYFESMNISNGCTNRDTIVVFESNELLLSSSSDTLICLGDTVNINTAPINYTDPVEYSWSTGDISPITNAVGGVDDSLFVTMEGVNDNCIGFDTIVVATNPEIYAEFSSFAGCTQGSGIIQLDSISGGAGGYEYAIDGGPYGPTSSFTNLAFSSHLIEVRDALGCTNFFEVQVTNNTGSPDMEFLVSTYNKAGDTVYAINTSPFTGFDSLVWMVPNDFDVIDVSDSMLVFSCGIDGWYTLELLGYQDTCSYSYTKLVSFGPDKPEYTNASDTLGIQSYNIYPNPTSGQFTLELEFGVAQSYSIIVTNNSGQPVQGMSASGNDDFINTNFTFPGGTSTGSYQIHIIGTHDATSTTIIYQ